MVWIRLDRSKKTVRYQWRRNVNLACGQVIIFPLTMPGKGFAILGGDLGGHVIHDALSPLKMPPSNRNWQSIWRPGRPIALGAPWEREEPTSSGPTKLLVHDWPLVHRDDAFRCRWPLWNGPGSRAHSHRFGRYLTTLGSEQAAHPDG